MQVTAEYTPTSSSTLAASATCTVTQDAGTATYSAPVVTLSYDKMPATGGEISPKLTYSQSYTINGASYTLTNESTQEDLAAAGLKIEYTCT